MQSCCKGFHGHWLLIVHVTSNDGRMGTTRLEMSTFWCVALSLRNAASPVAKEATRMQAIMHTAQRLPVSTVLVAKIKYWAQWPRLYHRHRT